MCPKFEGMAWSLAQMAPLNVRPPVLPPCSHSHVRRDRAVAARSLIRDKEVESGCEYRRVRAACNRAYAHT